MSEIDKAKAEARREVHELFSSRAVVKREDIFKIINKYVKDYK